MSDTLGTWTNPTYNQPTGHKHGSGLEHINLDTRIHLSNETHGSHIRLDPTCKRLHPTDDSGTYFSARTFVQELGTTQAHFSTALPHPTHRPSLFFACATYTWSAIVLLVRFRVPAHRGSEKPSSVGPVANRSTDSGTTCTCLALSNKQNQPRLSSHATIRFPVMASYCYCFLLRHQSEPGSDAGRTCSRHINMFNFYLCRYKEALYTCLTFE